MYIIYIYIYIYIVCVCIYIYMYTHNKWRWLVTGLVVYTPVVIAIVRIFRQTLIDKYSDVDRIELYSKVSLLTIIVWSLYPIVW